MADSYNLAANSFRQRATSTMKSIGQAGLRVTHNLKYWRREPYLASAPGAHSLTVRPAVRNEHDSALYVASIQTGKLPAEQIESVSAHKPTKKKCSSAFVNSPASISTTSNRRTPRHARKLPPLESAGLIERRGNLVRSLRKLSISNEVFVELLG